MNSVTISIVVPVYQVRSYLARCLDSILHQTYRNFEVIMVDDGSTDGSSEICDAYASEYDNFKVIHKPNGGLSSARNAGIDEATGQYIMFVDSDDVIHHQTVELEIALLEKNSADALICPLKRFENDSEIDASKEIVLVDNAVIVSGEEAERGFFNNPNASKYVSSCGKVYRRELFDDIRFPEGRLFEDEFTTYRIYYKCKKIVVIDTPFYYYYINNSGITQNLNLNKRFDEYDAQEGRISFFREKGNGELYHLALIEFLRTAQWDLINCQKKEQTFDENRGRNFQRQYQEVLEQAEQEKLISFKSNYDYYILAYPEKRMLLRIKRKIYSIFRKMR